MPKKASLPPKTAPRKSASGSTRRKAASAADADVSDPPSASGLPFPVVGIGASAGGFEALVRLLKHLPADTGMAFVVVLHLDPHHKSKLPELLARGASMPVREIRDRMSVEPNHVYILPSNTDVILARKTLRLMRRSESTRLHMPIDRLFASLAEEQADRAIGIVLSGTGTDGTTGCGTIKAESGITFAEAEASAKYFGMPRSAIDAGCVDAVLEVEAIAGELVRIAKHPLLRPQRRAREAEPFPESANALGKIFFLLKQHVGVDFSFYKPTTLKRRIARRMVLQRIEQVDDYVALLRSNRDEIAALFHDLLINVTSFFRDRQVHAALKKSVVSRLLKTRPDGAELRVWVPGCATGEEVYSLAISLTEEITRGPKSLKLQIFGTDLSEAAITKARAGIFPSTIAKDVSTERLRRFFVKSNGGYMINRNIRDICTFARQNLCEDPPFSRLDIISCRNVLIYLGPELQKKCIPVFHYALNPGGYLLLGSSETIGTATDLFELVDKKNRIYCKKNVQSAVARDLSLKPLPRIAPVKPDFGRPEPVPAPAPLSVQGQADKIILSRCVPSGVIIDKDLRVHEFRGRTGRFLEHSPGSATLNLLRMVRSGLIADLRTAIHSAQKKNAPARAAGIELKTNGGTQQVAIEVIPFTAVNQSWMLVLFEETAASTSGKMPVRKADGADSADGRERKEITRLRSELDASKESLQSTIESQEATNEELTSANEEIESANEELQSTNEELETAKEELQSTNEELTTLNEELSNRNLEMAQMNNDLNNLLTSISIPIIMVDNELAVRRATPLAEKLFNLIPTDIGRRLSDLRANLKMADLESVIREVMETLTVREQKVQDNQGRWYSMRIRPYRTRDNKIDGAVITLVDIDKEQRKISQLELASQSTDAILETVHEPLLILDGELRVRKASHAFYGMFKLARKKIDGVRFSDLDGGEWDVPHLRSLLEEILPKKTRLEGFAVEAHFRRLGPRSLLLNARRLENQGEPLVLLAIEDVTGTPAAAPKRAK